MPSLVEIGSVVLEKKIFIFCQCIFAKLLLFPLGKLRGHSFEKKNCIYFTHECFVLSLVEIRRVVIEKKIFEFRRCILLPVFHTCSYLPLENAVALHLNKLESPSLKDDALCQVWLKLAQ